MTREPLISLPNVTAHNRQLFIPASRPAPDPHLPSQRTPAQSTGQFPPRPVRAEPRPRRDDRRGGTDRGSRNPSAHDEELLREVVAEHGVAMRCYAFQLTGDRARADDVVQEALLRAWRNADALVNGRGSVRGWLLTIVRNLVTDGVRARRARPAEVSDVCPAGPVQRDHAERVVASVTVERALSRLSRPYREVLEQVYLAERSVKEAAEILQIPAGTVKSRCHYGLRALREIVGPSNGAAPGTSTPGPDRDAG